MSFPRLHPLAFLAILATVACAPDASAPPAEAPPPASTLVTAEWLESRLGEDGLAILHVGSDSSFAAGHVPGARPLALLSFAPEVAGLSTEMPDSEAFRTLLEDAGVSEDSRIVLYSATHPPQFATRLYLTLEHFGLGEQTSILDGGLRGWEAEGRPMNRGGSAHGSARASAHGADVASAKGPAGDQADPPEAPIRGSLPPLIPQGNFLVDADFVAARLEDGGARIVDARDPPFWTGAQQLQGRAQRPGRIPGAGNVPFRSLVDDAGHFLSLDSLRTLFREAGIQEGEPVVAYCHVGQQASLLTVAARLLGHPVYLYDGSWEEWSALGELPAEAEEAEGEG